MNCRISHWALALGTLAGAGACQDPPSVQESAPAAAPEVPAPAAPGVDEAAAPEPTAAETEAMRAALLGLHRAEPAEAKAAPPPKAAPRSRRVTGRAPAAPEVPAPAATLSDAEFNAAVRKWQGVKECLRLRPRSTPVKGAIKIAFDIEGTGAVRKARVLGQGPLDRSLGPCIVRRAEKVQFPAFGGVAAVTKQAKFVF